MEEQDLKEQIAEEKSQNENKSKFSGFAVFLALAVVLVGALFLFNKYKAKSGASFSSQETRLEENRQTSSETQTPSNMIEVEGGMYYFNPDVIKVKKGETVKISFRSVDGVHDFVIDEFDARTEIIREGQTAEVSFVADKTGEFEYYCSVGNHRALGMKGTLVVE
ncbi:MAG: hypothetical protein KatS3mg088_260 [Patescibacteria group bacterium]|nr:MAG: hypothetical protein KatS3mg088_260 [Patescibacteria group bacterium]